MATVMSPTPALPPVRRVSVWDKMVGTLKTPSKKEARNDDDDDIVSPLTGHHSGAVVTAVERRTSNIGVHKRNNSSVANRASIAVSTKSAKSRSTSMSSVSSRRSNRSIKNWWRSSNPCDDDTPPVPAIDNKFSMFGSHNPDADAKSPTSPVTPRRTYTPRNAAGSFLKTTTTCPMAESALETSLQANEKAQNQLSAARLSVMLKPLQIKSVELRKDSHIDPGMYGLHSMSGTCEIVDEVVVDSKTEQVETSYSVKPATGKGHKRTDSSLRRPQSARFDSAKTSIEFMQQGAPTPAGVTA